jgi:ribosomal-protein-alanine N-acetyltransferase
MEACFIEVGASNHAARALYAALGFTEAGLRPGYYRRGQGPAEDAILMRKGLAS